jgi:hypothetical protein
LDLLSEAERCDDDVGCISVLTPYGAGEAGKFNSYVRSLGWDHNTTYRFLSTLLANVLRRSYSFCETRAFLAPSLSRTEHRRESENRDETDREDLTGLTGLANMQRQLLQDKHDHFGIKNFEI